MMNDGSLTGGFQARTFPANPSGFWLLVSGFWFLDSFVTLIPPIVI